MVFNLLLKPKGLTIISLLALLQSMLMIAFFYIMLFGEVELIKINIPTSMFQIIGSIFIILGLGGLISAYGLWQLEKWCYWGIILTSISTIIFDLWGLTIQYMAIIGLVLPIILLAYILPRRRNFLGGFKS